ncbi:MAG: hypothetical protein A2420_02890 [Candidatus Moranbacteria bacterium RIFOXYC1_FULL_44_13]|nr:MAG: hypothetical protein A2184_02190 [Candidatus Moranbacteria bacterium RIFOXYA1_FULL_44_7]OGI32500.1 MAG: hypothetical protein A2420_02890 [Candidatus Moranbacteria bacterium RIFOXYC1_FULL_44_13]OGI37621.1 MAG: hypothetical protein A2612_04320 [Candidatus Moranbacteria bacterium RIFOXYD1_FULL_44_12]
MHHIFIKKKLTLFTIYKEFFKHTLLYFLSSDRSGSNIAAGAKIYKARFWHFLIPESKMRRRKCLKIITAENGKGASLQSGKRPLSRRAE